MLQLQLLVVPAPRYVYIHMSHNFSSLDNISNLYDVCMDNVGEEGELLWDSGGIPWMPRVVMISVLISVSRIFEERERVCWQQSPTFSEQPAFLY